MITYGSTTLTSYNSIVRTEVYYYKSTSATSLSGGSWSTTKPTWENGKYIWQKIRTVYEDGTHSESDPVNITGQQGATGTAAYSYKLNSSDSIIGKTKDGEYTIKKITFSATCKQGTGAVSAYGGRFKIESTTNGSTWKTEYTSSGNEASKEFTIPDDIIAIKCSLYQSGGTTVLLDIVTVPVVKDGVDAIGLRDSIPYYLASNKDTGITRLTQGWTRYRPQLTAEKKYLWVYYVSRYSEGTTEPELIEIKDDLVHFENNGNESPVESCVVDIDPVQDLHGYDSPWPAGGGKNLIIDAENIVIDKLGSAEGSRNEYSYINVGQSYMDVPDGTNVTISFDIEMVVNTANPRLQVYNTNNKGPKQIVGVTKTFTAAVGTTIKKRCSLTTTIADRSDTTQTNNAIEFYTNYGSSNFYRITNIMLEIGTTASAFEPYSNICPITGWTGVKVTRTGKNLFDKSATDTDNGYVAEKYIDSSGDLVQTANYNISEYVAVKPSTTYTIGGSSGSNPAVVFYDSEKQYISGIKYDSNESLTFVTPNNAEYVRMSFSVANVDVFQLEVGSTATDYEPYAGNLYPITFPSEAGTVYGGTLDVTTGRLIVDKASTVVISNNLSNNGSLDNIYKIFYRVTGRAFTKNVLCNYFNQDTAMLNYMSVRTNSTGIEFTIQNDLIGVDASADDHSVKLPAAKAWFTNNPVQLVYELAEPIIYQLTPQEITMLTGQNYIFSNTGQAAISYYDNQTSTDPYVDYSLTSAFDASTIEPAYIETEWVESTGKQYVYLDWKPPIKTWGFEIDFISYNALGTSVGAWNEDTNKNGYGTIFGVRNTSGVNNAQLSSYSNGVLRIGNGANQATGFKTNHTRQQIKLQNTTITKTDGTTSIVSRLDETANKPYCNMTVFGLHEGLRRAGNGGISEPSSTRIYSLKFYDGDTLTVDLVGAIRKRDSVTGLYDKVSKHFYPAPGMLFGDVIGDIGDSISMKEAMDKANPQTIVVNKDRTRMWEATVPFNDLQDGQKITVTYSYGNIVSSVETGELIGWDDTSNNQQVYLKLTFADGHKTDWIPCYYSNTGRLTTHYGAGIPIQLTYRENILANASETASGNMVLRGFFADANYDSNNTDIVRWSYGRVIAGSNKIFPYSIIMQNADERWESIVTSSTTAKTKTRNTHGFRLDTILYQAANTTTNENAENTSWQLRTGDPLMDMRYNLNIEDTNELRLVHGKSVYLVGTVGADGLFYLADQWWSQSLPTTEDGKIYIYLGQVYDWYRCGLATMHPIYKFVDGKLKSTLQIAVDALDKAKEVEQDLADLGADLQAQIDEKIQTYYQSTNPASAWTTADIRATHDGDLWCYTGATTSTYTKDNVYRYNASNNTWTTYSASGDLFDKVDGKTTVFYGKTTDTFTDVETGDYLVDATDGSSYRYDGSKWVKVTDYQAAIDNMSIGGRNLFVTASRFHPEENAFATTSTGKDNRIENFNVKGGIYTVEPFKAGDVITLQAQSNLPWNNRHASDGTAPNTVGFWIQAYDTMEDARARRNLKRSQFLTNDLGENHTSFLRTFTVPQSDDGRYYNFRFNSYSDGTQSVTAKFWDLQLERGNKATSWSPALEDLQVNIEGAEKRNLLLNTQKKTYSGYTMYYDLSESGRQLQEGEVVTFSMKATIPVDRKRWAIYNSGGYLAINQWEAIEPDGETAVIYTWTGVWKLYLNDEPVANDKLHVYIGAAGATSSVTVEWAKLERGNTMSTYSPAPEDINSSITTAQTTADEALAATQPISSKTFTDIIGTANDIANASFYFAKVHPTTYTDPWMVKMKIKASVLSDTNFRKTVDITIHGCRSNFISYDSIVANYNSNPIYYLNLYRATQVGIETNKKGHALGFGLRSSASPIDTNKKRTFEVDLLEVDGCTVDWIDTPVKYADMDGTGSTNYVGCTELGITSNGQNATNNDNTYDRIKYSTIKAAEAIARYNIIVGTSAGYKHLKSGTPWDITYPILYADAALNANATGSSNYLTIPFTVTTTQAITLTPYKPVYIEGTLEGTTFTPVDTTPLTQTVPTSDNGHQYILLGSAYSTTAINLEAEHPIYQFQNGNFVTVAEAASRIGANAENLIKATYAVCSTAAGTNAKTADCTNFELYEGVRIQVTFTNANTASAPTLNIHNTGAKAIYINKTAASSTNQLLWTAGSKMEFVYDGTGWIAQNVPYALYGTCSTGASTAAKAVTCNEAVICKGTTISVNMTNTNTAANATMNVGSTVAKDIYANGAKLTTNSRFNWRANTTQKFVFDGQVWRMDDDSVKALATAYITEIDDDGIMVHPEDDDTSGWAISDAIQLFKNGISYIKLWIENNIPKIRIGKEDQGHIVLDNDSVDVRDGDDVLATFGENTRIGTEDGTYLSLSTEGLIGSKNNLQYMQFLANGESETYGHVTSFTAGYGDSPQTYTHHISINESIKDYITFKFKTDDGLYGFTQQLEIKDSEETYTFVDSKSRYQVITRFISNSKDMTCYQTLTRLNSQAPKVRCTFGYIVTKQKQSPTFTLGTRVENSDQGLWSYSEGLNNIASGDFSYVEGENNTASGSYAHAEGKNVTASGLYSHAGGDSTTSDWAYTFVHGRHLISNDEAQAVFGTYNKRYNRPAYLFILGNGTGDEDEYRSDAFIVDYTGNIFLDINSSASSGTADAKLYDAITALGWQNDIINNM